MAQDQSRACPHHSQRHECPDALVAYSSRTDEYGLYIHDGGSSVMGIGFCPWCGTDLRRSAAAKLVQPH